VLVAVFAVTLALAPGVTRESQAAVGKAEARGVSVTVVGPDAVRTRLAEALPEFLSELDATVAYLMGSELELESVLEASPQFARVWVEVGATEARIFIVDQSATHVYIRRLELSEGLDVVAVDEIGYVVQSSLEALLGGGVIGISRDQAADELGLDQREVPAPPASAPEPRLAWPYLGAAAGYRLQGLGAGALSHGPSIGLVLAARYERALLGAAVRGGYWMPTRLQAAGFELQLSGGFVRGSALAGVQVSNRWRLSGRLGGGVDLVEDRAQALAAGAVAFEPTLRVVGIVGGAFGPSLVLGRRSHHVEVSLSATLDVAVSSFRYETADTDVVLFDPWVLRPGASLEIGWGWGQAPPGS
jgi:hypothetical protein